MKIVSEKIFRFKVKKLGDIYLTLGFDEIINELGTKDINLEKLLHEMISSGKL